MKKNKLRRRNKKPDQSAVTGTAAGTVSRAKSIFSAALVKEWQSKGLTNRDVRVQFMTGLGLSPQMFIIARPNLRDAIEQIREHGLWLDEEKTDWVSPHCIMRISLV